MNKQLKTLERTVVLQSPPLTKTKTDALMYIYRVNGEMLVEALEYMWGNNTTSWTRAKKVLYKKFREKYPDIPSHYIHEAIRDASQRLKSFLKLKRKGLAYTDKPIVKRWSVGCDNQLWKLTLSGVKIATQKGWINVPLQFHRLFTCLSTLNTWVILETTVENHFESVTLVLLLLRLLLSSHGTSSAFPGILWEGI